MLDLLQGIRVVSFNHFLFGPMGVQALADLGADVIAVETPEGAGKRRLPSLARTNQLSIGLDFLHDLCI
jgi:crotonobetainyl-CoA:carnitine CoA-transferase CaiB-like acyl-CoA transferase